VGPAGSWRDERALVYVATMSGLRRLWEMVMPKLSLALEMMVATLHHVGINLRESVFSHSQLYVALSQCTSSNRIKVLLPNGSTTTNVTNVVYPEALANVF